MTLTLHGAATAPDGRSCTGPLASHVEAFGAQLLHQGYAQSTVRAKCDLLADLSCWLERRGLPLAGLDESRLTQFLATRRQRSKTRRGDRATGRQLLERLRELEEIAAAVQSIDRTPVACLTREFEEFLHAERGLASSTVSDYSHMARDFLEDRFGGQALQLGRLRPQDLHGFVLREIRRVSRSCGKRTVAGLRSFLRFLLQRGAIQTDLARTLPGVATWRLSHLPKTLPPEQVEQLLGELRSQHTDGQARLRDPAAAGPARAAWRRGAGHDVGGSGLGAQRDCRAGQEPAARTSAAVCRSRRGAGLLSLRRPTSARDSARVHPDEGAAAWSCRAKCH